ncbi:MAG: septum site-determining protein MinC, partial [Gammaproteobacteria bacterium]|nr:septum site-determining protein MinC [Gammaproteobacteria bacterium]
MSRARCSRSGGSQSVDFNQLRRIVEQQQLIPVGVLSSSEQQQGAAREAGLALIKSGKPPLDDKGGDKQADKKRKAPVAQSDACAQVIRQNVRSGQQVYAKGGDLVVMGSVSPGAEILADGNIHIYGALRGRALAGAAGDTAAMIFCHNLQAELIAVAGNFRLSDDIHQRYLKQRVAVHLSDGKMLIDL